jgi:hypothetical protein
LEATTGFGGATADTVDIAAGFARDVSGNVASTDGVANAALSFSLAGQSVIDLGSYGKLIAPVQVDGGNWYYHWDRSGDGTSANTGSLNGGVDYTTHDVLDSVFNRDSNGVVGGLNTTDTYRYATINDVRLALPKQGGFASLPGLGGNENYPPGTAVGSATAANGSNAENSLYDDLLAIWDAYNGTGTDTNIKGTPSGWQASYYWSATSEGFNGPLNSGSPVHAYISLVNGGVGVNVDHVTSYVALQVL